MKNIKNNSIFGSVIITIIALNIMFLLPSLADAYMTKGAYMYCDGACNSDSTNNNSGSGNNVNIPKNNTSLPVIYSVDPIEVETGANTKNITILGTGFRPDSIARWNSSDRPTYYVNSNKIIMQLDPEDTQVKGKYLVTVVNPSPEGGKFSNPKIVNVIDKISGATTTSAATKVAGASTQKSSYTTKAATTKKVATVKKAAPTVKGDTTSKNTETCVATNTTDNDKNSSLTASAINSNNNFMPDTFLEWLILFALILFGVLIFRKLWLTDADYNKPLKHA